MYTFDRGWLKIWYPDGEKKVRFVPFPECKKWDSPEGIWKEDEVDELWIPDVKTHQLREQALRNPKDQMLFPGMDIPEKEVSPPRQDPGYAASKLWETVPKSWLDLLEPISFHPWRTLNMLTKYGHQAEKLLTANLQLGWLVSALYEPDKWRDHTPLHNAWENNLPDFPLGFLNLICIDPEPVMYEIVRKLNCDGCPANYISGLMMVQSSERAMKLFSDVPEIPYRLVRMMYPVIFPVLNAEILNGLLELSNTKRHYVEYIRNCLLKASDYYNREIPLPAFKSLKDVEAWYCEEEIKETRSVEMPSHRRSRSISPTHGKFQ